MLPPPFLVIAQGLLQWLRRVMQDDEFFVTFSAANPLPHLRMLDQVGLGVWWAGFSLLGFAS